MTAAERLTTTHPMGVTTVWTGFGSVSPFTEAAQGGLHLRNGGYAVGRGLRKDRPSRKRPIYAVFIRISSQYSGSVASVLWGKCV